MLPNTHPETGIPYGVIALANIDSDIAQELLYGSGEDITFKAAQQELRESIEHACRDALDLEQTQEVVELALELYADNYQCEEPVTEGEYDGVKYHISWLGGAQILLVAEGPLGVAKALCSPCIPNAADLDSGFCPVMEEDHFDYRHECYIVPHGWLRDE